MKVIEAKADGKWCELVMVPKLPEGEFDIDAVDLSGVEMSETHDDGSCIVAENQTQSKLDALAQRTVGKAHASRGNRALEEQAELTSMFLLGLGTIVCQTNRPWSKRWTSCEGLFSM